MDQQIELEGIRAVKNRIRIPIPEDGGFVVLTGDNGQGKSSTLDAVRAYIEGKGTLQANDDVDEGHVSGLGTAKLRVGRKTSRSGELVVHTLDGNDLWVFVDPHIDDPERAAVQRMKVLCRLAKVKPELAPFEELVGGPDALRAIATPKSLGMESLPEMAGAIKRDIETKARGLEAQRENEQGRAAGLRQAIEGVDLQGESDEKVLAHALEEIVREQSALDTRAKSSSLAQKTAEDAEALLGTARTGYSGQTVEAATGSLEIAMRQREVCRGAMEDAKEAARRAVTAYEDATNAWKTAGVELNRAEEHASSIKGWEQTIRAARESRPAPTPEEVQGVASRLQAARDAVNRGAILRRAKIEQAKADEAAAAAEELKAEGERLRGMAAACEDVVTAAIKRVAPRGMFVRRGLLYVQSDRGEELLSDLSKGERTSIGINVMVDALGEGGVITVPQELFEGLSPRARKEVDETLRSRKTVGLTAIATDGEIGVEVFDAGTSP